ncbi:MAG TPA: amidase [Burkholderiales bacterium]|nr:amidase [Burkholderiales bacterium]
MDLNRLTATEAARLIAARRISAEELVVACLARIEEREPVVRAWAFIDADRAVREARRLDRLKRPRGPLHGIPVGLKDIIDTRGMPTEYNSPIYRDHRPRRDAEVVSRLRAAGAVIFGKTKTSEFAYLEPANTRNPHNPRHTPGGSSSGSVAGVADFMMPLALGTQTGGSTIRPASYCGVFAFKPTYQRVPVTGIKALAPTFDTVGEIARSVEDLALLDSVLCARAEPRNTTRRGIRIGFCRTPFWTQTERSTRNVLAKTARALAAAGFDIQDVALPPEVELVSDGFYVVTGAEAAWALAREFRDHREQLSPVARRLIEHGGRLDADEVQRVRAATMHCALAVDRLFDGYDALLTPAAPGEAEKGNALGNNVFNRLWTAMHLPCLTIPAGTGPAGLPVGIQLVARRGADRTLLGLGQRVAALISERASAGRPRTADRADR